MKVLLTGAAGFLGWHTRTRFAALGRHEVVPVSRSDWSGLHTLIADVDAVVHVAGVNRGTGEEVENGNVALARDLVNALPFGRHRPSVIFANSVHAGSDTPYGAGKETASELLAMAAADYGLTYTDVRLPNLFGEHGRPRYNSFVPTFVEAIIAGVTPQISDRPISLLHVQQAAQTLLEALDVMETGRIEPQGTSTSVQEVFDRLHYFYGLYAKGDIPPLNSDVDIDLFNTLRAALVPTHYPIQLTPRTDHRGSLVEVVRAHGGQGQTFVSTTVPGVTRGEHFHLRKVERFVVLAGRARISLRRMYHEEIFSFDVDGATPGIIDMPTLWCHNIINTGSSELTTLFWTNELFDPQQPDTYPEPVVKPGGEVEGPR